MTRVEELDGRMIRMLAIIGVVITSPTLAQEKNAEFTASLKAEALNAFNSLATTADHEMYRCRLAGKMIFLDISLRLPTSSYNWDCIPIGKSSIAAKYGEIKAKVGGDKDALLALNDYAASLLAVFDDLRPRNQEREREYENRLATIETDLKRKANLVRLQLQ